MVAVARARAGSAPVEFLQGDAQQFDFALGFLRVQIAIEDALGVLVHGGQVQLSRGAHVVVAATA